MVPGAWATLESRLARCGALRRGGAPVISVYREGCGVAMILTRPASEGQFSDPSHLTAVWMAGGYRITSLQLNDPGVRLNFTIPRSEVLEAAQTNHSLKNVPVLRASK
jgi:hypothetical protein